MSGCLFALAESPFLRAMMSVSSIPLSIRAYADDIAAVLQNAAVHCTFHEGYSQRAAHAAFGVFHLHIEQQDIPEVAASRCMRDRRDPRRPVQSDDTPRMEYLKIRLS